jgi:hypothetical protein
MALGDALDREYNRFVVLPETVRAIVAALETAREPLIADR